MTLIPRRAKRVRRPEVEGLEPRQLLATFVITNTADSGPGSLRQALVDSETSAGSTVTFNIPGSGVHTITPSSALPVVTASIDGTTEPGYAGTPLIEIDGRNAGSAEGLYLTKSGLTIRGLDIHSFSLAGIFSPGDASGMFPGGNNRIEANFIGTDPTGTVAEGNGVGISLNTPNNLIGGLSPGAANVISGNAGAGVQVATYPRLDQGLAPPGNSNVIQGNLIGTDVSGRNPLGNGGDGILLEGSSQNTIGGTQNGAGNVISANLGDGIELKRASGAFESIVTPEGNQILGNSIGTDRSGALHLGNGQFGIDLRGGMANTVGGTAPGAGNTIIHNFGPGVIASPTGGDTIVGNATSPNQDQVVDLVVSVPNPTPAITQVVGQPISITFTITNNGPATATHAVFNLDLTVLLPGGIGELPPGVTVVSVTSSQGTIETLSPASFQANLGMLAPSASATVTIVSVFANPFNFYVFNGAVSADQVELNPADNAVQATVHTVPAPAVTHLTAVTPIPVGSSIALVRLNFDAPLDPTSAEQVANYRVIGPGPDYRFGTRDDVTYTVTSANYDSATNSVLLTLLSPLPRMGTFLRVSAGGTGTPGLVDVAGQPVQGDAGGPAVETVGIGTKLKYYDATENHVVISLARGGLIEIRLAPNKNAQSLTILGAVRGKSILSGKVHRAARGATGRTPIGIIIGLNTLDKSGIRLTNPPFINPQLPAKTKG
jgi:hypothetical protein